MKNFKIHWPERLRLPRRWRTVRNLLLAGCLVLAALSAMEWPMPTMRSAYRQLEGKLMLSPSEIVYSHKTNRETVYITRGDGWITAGIVEKMSYNNAWFRKNWAVIQYIVSEQELAVLPMSAQTKNQELVIAVHGFPEGTKQAEMELDLFGIENVWDHDLLSRADETITARAEPTKDGWLFFTFTPHDHTPNTCALKAMWSNHVFPWTGLDEYAYRLKFKDMQGNILDSVSDELPECSYMIL